MSKMSRLCSCTGYLAYRIYKISIAYMAIFVQ